jgi:hypothetical protein
MVLLLNGRKIKFKFYKTIEFHKIIDLFFHITHGVYNEL